MTMTMTTTTFDAIWMWNRIVCLWMRNSNSSPRIENPICNLFCCCAIIHDQYWRKLYYVGWRCMGLSLVILYPHSSFIRSRLRFGLFSFPFPRLQSLIPNLIFKHIYVNYCKFPMSWYVCVNCKYCTWNLYTFKFD